TASSRRAPTARLRANAAGPWAIRTSPKRVRAIPESRRCAEQRRHPARNRARRYARTSQKNRLGTGESLRASGRQIKGKIAPPVVVSVGAISRSRSSDRTTLNSRPEAAPTESELFGHHHDADRHDHVG